MTDASPYGLEWFRKELDKAIASYQSPPERRVGHGNLRHEYSTWRRDDEEITNVAVIYETPGGSTTQLNITYNHKDGSFSYLDSELGDTICTKDGREALQAIQAHVREIPRKREQQLQQQVAAWMNQGKSKRDVFVELNKLLQTELLGGRINVHELKASIQHAVRLKSQLGTSQ